MNDKITILMVDDDPEDRMIFYEAIKELKPEIQCEMMPGGEEALQYLNSLLRLPDFLFVDINMARMDGYEFCAELGKIEKYAAIPIVIYAGVITPEIIKEFDALGARYFFVKPVTIDEIKEIILAVVNAEKKIHSEGYYRNVA